MYPRISLSNNFIIINFFALPDAGIFGGNNYLFTEFPCDGLYQQLTSNLYINTKITYRRNDYKAEWFSISDWNGLNTFARYHDQLRLRFLSYILALTINCCFSLIFAFTVMLFFRRRPRHLAKNTERGLFQFVYGANLNRMVRGFYFQCLVIQIRRNLCYQSIIYLMEQENTHGSLKG